MPGPVTRRDLLAQLGVTAAATIGASAAGIGVAGMARAQDWHVYWKGLPTESIPEAIASALAQPVDFASS